MNLMARKYEENLIWNKGPQSQLYGQGGEEGIEGKNVIGIDFMQSAVVLLCFFLKFVASITQIIKVIIIPLLLE
jgi:hypothetical protein